MTRIDCRHRTILGGIATLLATAACTDDAQGTGSLTVILEPETTVIDGISAGEGIENIRDGWTATFEKYVVVIGDIALRSATDDDTEAEAAAVYAVDLARLPASGVALWEIDDLVAGRWEFNYALSGAAHDAERHESVETLDFDAMVEHDWTYWVVGAIEHPEGRSCPPRSLATPPTDAVGVGQNSGGDECYANPSVHFALGVSAETGFGPCEVDGVPGFAIAANANKSVAVTLHGDHLFFNGFPEGDEGGTVRLAQWLADCDLDLDGEVTVDELAAIDPSLLVELDDRFQLGGSPITPLASMLDYVTAQLKTQGHFQGEGECPLDGMVHDH